MSKLEYYGVEFLAHQKEHLERNDFAFDSKIIQRVTTDEELTEFLDYIDFDSEPHRYRMRIMVASGGKVLAQVGIHADLGQGTDSFYELGSFVTSSTRIDAVLHPFTHNGQDYAVYSPQSDITRFISLPDCEDLGIEINHNQSVPWDFSQADEYVEGLEHILFMSYYDARKTGTRKIKLLDISEIEVGNVEFKEHAEISDHVLPFDGKLSTHLSYNNYDCTSECSITINTIKEYNLKNL